MKKQFRVGITTTPKRVTCPDCGGFKEVKQRGPTIAESLAYLRRHIREEDERNAERLAARSERVEPPKPYDLALGRSVLDPGEPSEIDYSARFMRHPDSQRAEAPKPYDLALGRDILSPPAVRTVSKGAA